MSVPQLDLWEACLDVFLEIAAIDEVPSTVEEEIVRESKTFPFLTRRGRTTIDLDEPTELEDTFGCHGLVKVAVHIG